MGSNLSKEDELNLIQSELSKRTSAGRVKESLEALEKLKLVTR